MKKFQTRFIINLFGIALIAFLMRSVIIHGSAALIAAALILGVLNAVIKPAMIILTLPVNILTLGLFTFVINGFLLYFTAGLVPGFDIAGFGSAVAGGIILSLISITANMLV